MLSVIVPIYNVEKYLTKCIESIINQKYKCLEILLIDDGSTDGCPQICDKYEKKDSRVKVLHKVNEGLVRARKLGLDYATGEYIAFVDGDDWIETDMYSQMMSIIEKSDADFIDSGHFYDKDGKLVVENRLECKNCKLDKEAKHKMFLAFMDLDHSVEISWSIWSKIFKANIIKNSYAKVPDNLQYGEDAINYLYCIINSNKIIQIGKSFYHYNYREESMTHIKSISLIRKELELWDCCGKIILKYDTLLTQNELDECIFRRLYSAFANLLLQKFDAMQYYSFPYINELFNKKIVIYGAGKVGRDYVNQISKYEKCEIVGWVDKNYKSFSNEYRQVMGIDELLKKVYDIILISVEKEELANEIRNSLLENGISDSSIMWRRPNTAF